MAAREKHARRSLQRVGSHCMACAEYENAIMSIQITDFANASHNTLLQLLAFIAAHILSLYCDVNEQLSTNPRLTRLLQQLPMPRIVLS